MVKLMLCHTAWAKDKVKIPKGLPARKIFLFSSANRRHRFVYIHNGASEGFLSLFPSDQALDSIWLKEKQDFPYIEVVRQIFSKEIGKHCWQKHNLKVIYRCCQISIWSLRDVGQSCVQLSEEVGDISKGGDTELQYYSITLVQYYTLKQ